MYCKKCGQEIRDDAVVCVHCGCMVEEEKNKLTGESKTGMGVVMGLFLGVIGLIIGICLYPEGSIERKTFIKAWLITFFVTLAVAVLLYVILFASVFSAIY